MTSDRTGDGRPVGIQAAIAAQAGETDHPALAPRHPGPICTTLQEFYKVGPGPSSSHTMGPMRAAYDYFQRVSALPASVLARATALRIHLFGSLSATGRGHGTDRAALAGLLGQSPAECPPELLDGLARDPGRIHEVAIGPATLQVSTADIVFDATRGAFPHPNTMTGRLMAGSETLHELEYYSTGGGFIEWKGFVPPPKGRPRFPYARASDLKRYLFDDGVPLARLLLDNERDLTGQSKKQVWEFLDQVMEVMVRGVERGLETEGLLPGPIQLPAKAAAIQLNLDRSTKGLPSHVLTQLGAYAFAMSEENARGHIVVTAPTAGSAGIVPATLRSLIDSGIPLARLREGLLAAAAVGYLCKHNATLSGAEGGCQAEVGVGSAMAAAMIAQAMGAGPQIVANAAESALEHHLGLTCDPVAGFVQIPCIERCAFGAAKAWMAYCIASEENPGQRRVDLDTCVAAMALTAREMNSKYKETSEGGLAVSVVVC